MLNLFRHLTGQANQYVDGLAYGMLKQVQHDLLISRRHSAGAEQRH